MLKKPLKKILFVDDDPDILTIIKFCFESYPDIEVKFTTSGEEAIREAFIFKPDLILVDVMMPKMDGISVLKVWRLLPSLNQIPFIFITAKVQKEEIDSYLKMGVLDVIIKPFDPITLISSIIKIWDSFCERS